MKAKNKVIKVYLKEVSAKLNCSVAMKSVFLSELKGNIEDFAKTGSLISKDDLYKEFGTPDEISVGFLDRKDYCILLKKAKRKAFVWKLISIGVSVLLVLVICCVIFLLQKYGGTVDVTNVYNIHN